MKEKTIELGKVRQGERFKLDGVEFVALDCDEEATFALTADTLSECCAFEDDDAEREDHNNFSGSLIQKHMERFFREQHSPIFKAIVERPIDLTSMDGMTTYGKPFTVARLLTIDEFRKYRRFIPLTSKPFWTATPWTIVIPYIKSRTTAQQQAEINAWVKIAVTAAEQIYRGSGRGEEKKAYVLNWLAEHGITLDEDRIDALIEAAVYELNHGVLKEGAGNE